MRFCVFAFCTVGADEGCGLDQSVGNLAARAGEVEVLDWVWHRSSETTAWNEFEICAEAARSGNIDALRWCVRNKLEWDNRACQGAARSGSVAMLEFTVESGVHLIGGVIRLYSSAIPEGHVAVLLWLSTCELPEFEWDSQDVLEQSFRGFGGKTVDEKAAFFREVLDICKRSYLSHANLSRIVALGPDHFDLLRENAGRVVGFPGMIPPVSEFGFSPAELALVTGSLRAFDFLVSNFFPIDENKILSCCLYGGHVGVLRALVERDGLVWTEASDRLGFTKAASEDRVEDLKSCVAQPGGSSAVFGGDRGLDVCRHAAACGSLRVLKLALESTSREQIEADDVLCDCAIISGDLGAVKMVVEAGSPLPRNGVLNATRDGHADVAAFLADRSRGSGSS